jgi:FAD/FMN-containing dehydrogenase
MDEDELARELKGEVIAPAPEMYARDYGNLVRMTPRAVVIPETAADVQAVVSYARRNGLRVVSRGHACTGNGQALSDQIVLDSKRLNDFRSVSADVVAVGGGTRWGELQDRLVSLGYSNRVLTDRAAHTVGGTLSMGGYGQASSLLGGQVDQVVALDIVTGTGELIHATPDGPASDLFKYTLCGLGQTGIIVGAHLKVEPLRAFTVTLTRHLPGTTTITEINEIIREADPPWDTVQIGYSPQHGAWEILTGMFKEEEPERLEDGWTAVEHNYRRRYALMDAFLDGFAGAHITAGLASSRDEVSFLLGDWNVPAPNAEPFFEKLKKLFNDPRMSPGILGLVLRNARVAARLPLSPVPDADMVDSLSPVCIVPSSMVEDYKSRCEEAMDACLEAGGRVYIYGYYPRSMDFFKRNLGEETFATWLAVKEKFDPGNILGAVLF